MQIHQFQVSYVAEHDRILVLMRSPRGEDQGLWLTRRMLRGLYPHLESTLAELVAAHATPTGSDTHLRHATEFSQGHDFVQQTDGETAIAALHYVDGEAEKPLLVTTAHIQVINRELLCLRLEETLPQAPASRELEIHMDHDTLMALLHVIELAIRHSDWEWNPPLRPAQSMPATTDAEAPSTHPEWDALAMAAPPKYLN